MEVKSFMCSPVVGEITKMYNYRSLLIRNKVFLNEYFIGNYRTFAEMILFSIFNILEYFIIIISIAIKI